MDIEARSYAHPDVVRLVEQIQAEYVVLYGGNDGAAIEDEDFSPPRGRFLVGYLDAQPVAMAGWRWIVERFNLPSDGCAELKRMYVAPAYRGRGLSREMLAAIEESAAAAGVRHLVLESGQKQPAALTLYASCGYTPVDGGGWSHYYGYPDAVHLGRRLTG